MKEKSLFDIEHFKEEAIQDFYNSKGLNLLVTIPLKVVSKIKTPVFYNELSQKIISIMNNNTLIQQKSRIELLDILRGIAICGIIYMNIYHVFKPTTEILMSDSSMIQLFDVFFQAKFYTIFSFLFGLGAFIFIQNARLKYEKAYLLFMKRLTFLFLAGLLHVQFLPGEALSYYGFLGFFLLIAFQLKPQYNLILSVFFMICAGIMLASNFSILAMFFLGYYIGQINFIKNLNSNRLWMFVAALILGSLSYYSNTVLIPRFFAQNYYSKIIALTGIAQSITYMSIIGLLYSFGGIFSKILSVFGPMGRMAFTNYIAQTILMIAIAVFFQMEGITHYNITVKIASGILLFQLIYSHIYFQYFSVGPLEKLWRMWTYSSFWLKPKNGIATSVT